MLKKMIYLGTILTALTVVGFVQPAVAGESFECCRCKGKKEKSKDKEKNKDKEKEKDKNKDKDKTNE